LYIFATEFPKVQDRLPEPETRRATNVASRTHEVSAGVSADPCSNWILRERLDRPLIGLPEVAQGGQQPGRGQEERFIQ
jgi:hypothetical protein